MLIFLYFYFNTTYFLGNKTVNFFLDKLSFYSLEKTSFFTFIIINYRKLIYLVISLCQNNYYFNEIYNYYSLLNFYFFFQEIFLIFDKGLLELLGPTGLSKIYLKCVNYISIFFKQGFLENFIIIFSSFFLFLLLFNIFMRVSDVIEAYRSSKPTV